MRRDLRLRALEGQLLSHLLRQGARKLLAWLGLSLLAWSLGQLGFVLLGPPAWASSALLLGLLSLAPLALFWPDEEGTLLRELRRLDPDTTLEAWLGARPGPARDLLCLRARQVDEGLGFRKMPGAPGFYRGLGRLFSLACLGLAVLQLVALLVLHHPLLAWSAAEASRTRATGLGRAIEEEASPGQAEAYRYAEEEERQAPDASPWREGLSAEEGELSLGQGTSLARRLGKGEEASAAEAEAKSEPSPGEAGPGPGSLPGLGQGREDQAGPGIEMAGAGGGTAKDAPRKGQGGKAGAGQGFSGSGPMPSDSPLESYLTRLLGADTSSPGKSKTASRDLGLAELRAFERRYFLSLSLGPGLLRRDSGRALQLKARWKALKGRGR